MVHHAREFKQAYTMIVEILTKRLSLMKQSLRDRGQWPVDDSLGIDPSQKHVWEEFHCSPHSWVPVRTNTLPRLGDDPDNELHAILNAPANVFFRRGLARPHLVWAQKIGGGPKRESVPAISTCTPLDYLELEELIHGFSAIEALLLHHN